MSIQKYNRQDIQQPPIQMIDTFMQPDQQRVVHATNVDASKHAWIISLIVVVAVPVMLFLFLWFLMTIIAAPKALALIMPFFISLGAMVILGKYSMTRLTGDAVAESEIKEMNFTQRKQADIVHNVAKLHYDVEKTRVETQHELAMAVEMNNAANQGSNEEQMRVLMAINANLVKALDAGCEAGLTTSERAFVPAQSSEARKAAKDWLYQIVEQAPSSGELANVASLKMPWNLPENRQESRAIKELLLQHALTQVGTTYTWKSGIDAHAIIDNLRNW